MKRLHGFAIFSVCLLIAAGSPAHALTCRAGKEGVLLRNINGRIVAKWPANTQFEVAEHDRLYWRTKARNGTTYFVKKDPTEKYLLCGQY